MRPGARRRMTRGHLLLEAVAGGVVLLLAIAAISTALSASSTSMSRANINQQAEQEALAKIEALRAAPLTSTAWAVGTTSGNLTGAHANWTWQIQITPISDALDAGINPPTLTYRKAVVTITYGSGDVQNQKLALETFKW